MENVNESITFMRLRIIFMYHSATAVTPGQSACLHYVTLKQVSTEHTKTHTNSPSRSLSMTPVKINFGVWSPCLLTYRSRWTRRSSPQAAGAQSRETVRIKHRVGWLFVLPCDGLALHEWAALRVKGFTALALALIIKRTTFNAVCLICAIGKCWLVIFPRRGIWAIGDR
jgi:hypothetical protein